LQALKEAHPNWVFVPQNTNINWQDAMTGQMYGARSLVPYYFDEYLRKGAYCDGQWHYASETAVSYYMDPRNWLNENYIFQFEQLTYNASYHTGDAVQAMLNGSFMAGVAPLDTRTYAQIFWDVGVAQGISPFHLANRAYHEQGVNGTSPLISGTYPGFEGLYNFYNISAAGPTDAEIFVNGLTRARNEGWVSPFLSIQGGADFIAKNYIKIGQDTSYLQKFDLVGEWFTHQYMQAVYAPSTESAKMAKLYKDIGVINNTFVFKIPVYNNMPGFETVPESEYNISLDLPAGYSPTTSVFIDGLERKPAMDANGKLVVNAASPNAKTAIMYKYDANGAPIGMNVWLLKYEENAYTAAQAPELNDLLSYHGFSVRISGNSGIRFKSGISDITRDALATTGINGYMLDEYGTMVMTNANRETLPFVKGGEKVTHGSAFERNATGVYKDAIFEHIDGRYRFTSTLVGLPVANYNTDFVFCGYAIISKDGAQYTIYGPPVARSIFTVSYALLAQGAYPAGSAAYEFLGRIVTEAVNYVG
jgi:beta-N-acetylglucosaminidase